MGAIGLCEMCKKEPMAGSMNLCEECWKKYKREMWGCDNLQDWWKGSVNGRIN